jgi:hypothetical protein
MLTMSETKTHWRKGDKSDYLMSWDLENEMNATIVKVVKIKTKIRGKEELCRVAYFKENLKPMIINVTNGQVIERLTGTHLIEDWANISIGVTIYVQGGVRFGKDTVRALRIKPSVIVLPKLTKDMPAYSKAVAHLKNGGLISDIETKYLLTEQIKTDLQNDAI